MPSVNDNFDELVRKIEKGRDFTSASFEPVYYLVFDPSEILVVKRLTRAWASRLKQKNFEPHFFSIADAIREIHANTPKRKHWLKHDANDPLNWEEVNNSLKVELESKKNKPSPLQTRIEAKLAELESKPNAILIVTDLEALHPYLRIGAIESQLYGQFKVPTVFLYPGTRSGKTRLSFLGFYPEDGNYRSVHVGG
ncbi:MAG: BREX protein BrxB domain-containing protein [Planctomycetota bacterium]